MESQSLIPAFDFCPTSWLYPCLESCTRNPATCCLYDSPGKAGKQTLEAALGCEPPLCRVCGETEPSNFWLPSVRTICKSCRNNQIRANEQSKRKAAGYMKTRVCRQCGLQFQYPPYNRSVLCPACRMQT